MDTAYVGFYARFDTLSKKEAAALLGADNLVGDMFDIVFETEEGNTIAWMKNRFGKLVGFFDAKTTHQLRVLKARDWHTEALLSFMAFTDRPEPGHYWGEAAVICFSPDQSEIFSQFSEGIANRLMDGVRPDIDLGEQGIKQVIESGGSWLPSKSVPLPKGQTGTVIMKNSRKISEKFIEQGRKGNKGCYLISWIFLIALAGSIVVALKSCNVF
ncbi:MAG: hypothetical protein RR934_03465 [Gordonibacter sp.]|uniref:hypothetical protein n=1 Tax=Gordonibacter sp. TaxID=1968902 RepID=UPI003035D50D